MEYYLIDIATGAHVKLGHRNGRTNSNKERDFPPDLTHKGLKWYPVLRESKPSYNPATHKEPTASNSVDGENYVLGWNAPVAYTQEQLDARAAAAAEAKEDADESEATRSVAELWGKVAFNMENRVRVLEGKPAINVAQYKAALKARL